MLKSASKKDENNLKYSIYENGLIGKGSFGSVYAALDNITQKEVAIKHTQGFSGCAESSKQLAREVIVLRLLKGHPCIISLEDLFISKAENGLIGVNLVFERYPFDLNRLIKSKKTLSTNQIEFLLYQILDGIHYVHSASWIHRDLKPHNILVNLACKIKICDFGLARPTQDMISENEVTPYAELTDYVVTRWYRSPEVILRCSTLGNASVDIWSIGCILAELVLQAPLFKGDNAVHVLGLIFDCIGTPDPNDEWIDNQKSRDYIRSYTHRTDQGFKQTFEREDPSLVDLLKKLLELNPKKRISAAEALPHSFFSSDSYKKPDLLKFPENFGTKEVKDSFLNYYKLETKLEKNTPPLQPKQVVQESYKLIKKEAILYGLDSSLFPAPVPVRVPESAPRLLPGIFPFIDYLNSSIFNNSASSEITNAIKSPKNDTNNETHEKLNQDMPPPTQSL